MTIIKVYVKNKPSVVSQPNKKNHNGSQNEIYIYINIYIYIYIYIFPVVITDASQK